MSEPELVPVKSVPEPKSSIKDRIKSNAQVKGELLKVPEWDITLEVRSMSISQKSNILNTDDELGMGNVDMFMPETIIATCYDPDTGEKVWNADDLDWLKDQPAKIIETVASKGIDVSSLSVAAREEKKEDE